MSNVGGWPAERLKRHATVTISNVDKKSVPGEASVALCNYTDVYYNDVITDDLPLMEATASREQIHEFGLRTGDVLITKDSETPEDIGVPAFVPKSLDGVLCGYHLAVLRSRPGQLVPKYLFWALKTSLSRAQLACSATGVTRYGLRAGSIADVDILVPSLEAQFQVCDFLDAETARIDALIAKRQSMTSLLNQRRDAVTHDGVSGLLTSTQPRVDSRVPWLKTRPADWRDAKLTLVAELGSGHTPSRGHPEWWEGATIPWITTGEVIQMRSDRIEHLYETREKVSELGLANSAAVVHPAETVVLCRTASAGFSAIMGTEMATSQDFATWTCGPLLRPRFLLLCLRVMRPDLLGRLAMGSTHKTIYMPDIEAIRIPLPSVREQDAIVEGVQRRLRSIDRVIEALTRQMALLKERRQALITAAVTGELDVTRGAA